MKTDAGSPEKQLIDEIREAYAKTYPNCIFSLTNHIERLKAELKAIETALAAKDAALIGVVDDDAGNSSTVLIRAHAEWVKTVMGHSEESLAEVAEWFNALACRIDTCEAALSPPTGKVLIDIEKLREIEWQGPRIQTEAFDCVYCPACKGRIGNHESDCWLGNKLKEESDA